ncbi:UNVERIFIED_CONTAM: hypothetical protein Sindi_1832700, partial [Sesamum indicum]
GYVFDKPFPTALLERSSLEEPVILVSMSNDIQKQYDRLDDVPSIMLCMKEVYVVPDRHIRYATTKVFLGTKTTEELSVQSHRSLPSSYNPFIINYNMNGLEKSIHELFNMLVHYEATTHKPIPMELIREISASKAKGKRAGHWKRKKGKGKEIAPATSSLSTPTAFVRMGKGKGKVG